MKTAVRGACVAAVAALALFVGVSTASPGIVAFGQGCYQSGAAMTTAGPLQFRYGWGVYDPTKLDKFLKVQSMAYSVTYNGTPTNYATAVGDLTGWEKLPPSVNGEGNTVYTGRYTSPVIANLASGESATLHFELSVKNRVYDDSAQKIGYGPGVILTMNCTFTAS